MGAVRLTNESRRAIQRAVLRHRFAEAAGKIQDRAAQLGQDLWAAAFTLREHELMASLPDGWLPRVQSVRVQVGPTFYSIDLSGDQWPLWRRGCTQALITQREQVSRPVPASREFCALCAIEVNSSLGKRVLQLEQDTDRLAEEVAPAEAQVWVALNQVTTLGALLSAWPEVGPLVPARLMEGRGELPALSATDLNRMLGLPVEDVA